MSVQSPIIKQVVDYILQHDKDRLRNQLNNINRENIKLGGMHYGFVYGGEFYTSLPAKERLKAVRIALDESLNAQMHDYVVTKKIIEQDKIRIEQTLHALLIGCITWQDVRDALPNGIAEILPETKDLPRTREEAFNLVGNERAKRQYERNSALIAKYLMARFMF